MNIRDLQDRDIQNLLRMAGEAERLESGHLEQDSLPLFRIQPARSPALRLFRAGALGAMAACVMLAGVLSLKFAFPAPTPNIVQPGPGMAHRDARSVAPTSPTELASNSPDQACVVLTVFRGNEGECKCVQVTNHDLSDRKLEDIPRAELIKLALNTPCTTTANKVLVLAFSGRADALPRTAEDAEAIARQMEDSPSSTDMASLAYAALPGLGADATVVAETVAWKRATLPTDLGFAANFR